LNSKKKSPKVGTKTALERALKTFLPENLVTFITMQIKILAPRTNGNDI
jgi:hypothetical protein